MDLHPLYVKRTARGRRNRLRHLFRAEGTGVRSVCGDAQSVMTPDDAKLDCQECQLVALTEIALALDSIGAETAAVAVARSARLKSYEIGGAIADNA